MIRKHRDENVFPEHKAESKQNESKGETRKCTRSRKAVTPKKKSKTNSNENKFKFKCSDIAFMYDHTLHDTLYQTYVFLFETGIQNGKRGFCTRQKFQKNFQRERR